MSIHSQSISNNTKTKVKSFFKKNPYYEFFLQSAKNLREI